MYRYTYKVTLTNKNSSLYNHYYYGKRQTENLDDGYIGSGKILLRYLKKYPNDYIREIISFYDDSESLCKAEYDLIHSVLGVDPLNINLMEGGHGGAQLKETYQKAAPKISDTLKEYYKEHPKIFSEDCTNKISNSLIDKYKTGWKRNYVNNGIEEKIVDDNELEEYLNAGWIRGGIKAKKQRINNGTKEKNILKTDLPFYLNQGWKIGGLSNPKRNKKLKGHFVSAETRKKQSDIHKDRIGIVKDNKRKYIKKADLDKYITDGYVLCSAQQMKQKNI